MISLAISILWLVIGITHVLLGVIWIAALCGQAVHARIPAPIEKAIWAIAFILVLIGALSLLAGGGVSGMHFPVIR